jgi:glycerophosphoryl diester phosphodiesterase
MNLKKIKLEELQYNKNISKKIHFCYKTDLLHRDYQNLYYKTNFVNKSFEMNTTNKVIVPMTLNETENNYSFFGDPVEIFFSEKISKSIYQELISIFKEINSETKFKIEIKDEKLLNEKHDYIEKIINEIYIDLSLKLDQIKSNFSSNHRNEISKNYLNSTFEIIDYKNYKKDTIFEMMELHKHVSGRQTRSIESWKKNEKMILEKKGFITKVKLDNKVISFSFFYHNNFTCIYASSVGLREYYKIVRNMHHKSLWLAINYAKKYCNYFYIGPITIYSKENISEKEKNLQKFKNKFKGINKKFIIINKLPNYETLKQIFL